MSNVLDIIIVVVVAVAAWRGYRKGLVMTLCGFLAVFVALAGATVLANPSASNETAGKAACRRRLVAGQSAQLLAGYLYASAGVEESTADLVFAGHSLIAENGVLLAESPLLQGGLTCSELDLQRLAFARSRMGTFPPPEK